MQINTITDLLYGKSTAPGRVRAYLENKAAGHNDLLPYSCKLRVYDNDLPYELSRTSKDLRWGAGVKLVLDNYVAPAPIKPKKWCFILDAEHPDFDKLTAHQRKFLWDTCYTGEIIWGINVGDFMEGAPTSNNPIEGRVSIEDSWATMWEALHDDHTDYIVVNLNDLRPNGSQNGRGLTSTGPVGDGTEESNVASFLAIYEHIAIYAHSPSITNFIKLFGVLNNTIRRGGLYKNGIVCSSLWWAHKDIEEYLSIPLVSIAGSHKKAVGVSSAILDQPSLMKLIQEKVRDESVFLEKRKTDAAAYPNVCVGLSVPDDGTCLIWRVNFGMCAGPEDIIEAYKQTAYSLTKLHLSWREDNPEKAKYSAPLKYDRQIGLDVMGLANYLALHEISYQEFVNAIELFFVDESDSLEFCEGLVAGTSQEAMNLIRAVVKGQQEAIKICDTLTNEANLPRLERIFCVEPAQSHSYETFDLSGRTTCRGIWPPVGRRVNFQSSTRQNRTVMHGKVETVTSVSEDLYEQIHEAYQRLMNLSNRAHYISYDLRREPTEDWFTYFLLDSPLKTKYYTEIASTDQSYLSKTIKEIK